MLKNKGIRDDGGADIRDLVLPDTELVFGVPLFYARASDLEDVFRLGFVLAGLGLHSIKTETC